MPYKVFVCSLTVDKASAGRMAPHLIWQIGSGAILPEVCLHLEDPGSSYVPPFELSGIALTFGFKWIVTTSVALDHATLWLWMCRCQPVCNSRGGKAEGGFCGAYASMLLIILVCWCLSVPLAVSVFKGCRMDLLCYANSDWCCLWGANYWLLHVEVCSSLLGCWYSVSVCT